MAAVWQQILFLRFPFEPWLRASVSYRVFGLLQGWRGGSWLLQWAEPLGAMILCVLLVAAPFVSTTLIGFLLLACAGYWILLSLSDLPLGQVTGIHLLVALYGGIAAIATVLSPVKGAALSGLVQLLLYLIFFAFCARVLRSPKILAAVIWVYLMVSLVVSGYGIRQEFFGVEQLATWNDPLSEFANDTRVYSYLGNPNLLAGYLLGAIAFSGVAMLIWRTKIQKTLAAVMFVTNAACLFFTDSRGGWLAMVGAAVVGGLLLYSWYGDRLSPFWRKWLLPLCFGFGAGLLLIAVLGVDAIRLRLLSIFSWRGDSSNNFRINVWLAVLRMIGDRPLLGIGPGHDAFNAVYPQYMESRFSALSAYSIFLETAVETGLLGLTTFVWLLINIFSQALQSLKDFQSQHKIEGLWLVGAIAAMTGLLIQGLFDTVWYRPQVNTLWWLMVGIIAAQIPPCQPTGRDNPSP
ncbi:IctB family putative bicarbonate transporter [Picosynechococcus sp. PCC 8807]|uniref:IctB family putative bicarbonate transporter n=1 Tax=Picosynechococcus sp. PCC 8807 TaxID=195248 RepID=UPI0008108607|nr:IctB family putative bicarbonate transporter [Picosynechococcus sp. PCC 8807]ANV89782.1 putative bicarbonate transporter, IctB family [Picosynechococcus sp. PCC 8807]